MELKDYQSEVIADLQNYLYWLNKTQILDKALFDLPSNKPSSTAMKSN